MVESGSALAAAPLLLRCHAVHLQVLLPGLVLQDAPALMTIDLDEEQSRGGLVQRGATGCTGCSRGVVRAVQCTRAAAVHVDATHTLFYNLSD